MNKISRQVAIGALVAAFLALGASANPESGVVGSQSTMLRVEPNIGVLERITAASEPIASTAIRICAGSSQSTPRVGESYAFFTAAFQSCRDRALTDALDAFAEAVARLK